MKLLFTTVSLRLLGPLPQPMEAYYGNGADPVVDLDAGVGVDLGLYHWKFGDLVVSPTVDGYYRAWDGFVPIRALVIEGGVDVGWRWDTCHMTGDALTCFVYDLGFGPHMSNLSMAGGSAQGGAHAGGHTGLGIVVGKGDVRFSTGLRFSVGLGLGTYSGGTSVDTKTVAWTYTIGGFRGAWSAGVEFR